VPGEGILNRSTRSELEALFKTGIHSSGHFETPFYRRSWNSPAGSLGAGRNFAGSGAFHRFTFSRIRVVQTSGYCAPELQHIDILSVVRSALGCTGLAERRISPHRGWTSAWNVMRKVRRLAGMRTLIRFRVLKHGPFQTYYASNVSAPKLCIWITIPEIRGQHNWGMGSWAIFNTNSSALLFATVAPVLSVTRQHAVTSYAIGCVATWRYILRLRSELFLCDLKGLTCGNYLLVGSGFGTQARRHNRNQPRSKLKPADLVEASI
jgi:hypothetical protein